jgi:hypothetical protein
LKIKSDRKWKFLNKEEKKEEGNFDPFPLIRVFHGLNFNSGVGGISTGTLSRIIIIFIIKNFKAKNHIIENSYKLLKIKLEGGLLKNPFSPPPTSYLFEEKRTFVEQI